MRDTLKAACDIARVAAARDEDAVVEHLLSSSLLLPPPPQSPVNCLATP